MLTFDYTIALVYVECGSGGKKPRDLDSNLDAVAVDSPQQDLNPSHLPIFLPHFSLTSLLPVFCWIGCLIS